MTEKWNVDQKVLHNLLRDWQRRGIYVFQQWQNYMLLLKLTERKSGLLNMENLHFRSRYLGEDGTIYLCGETADGGIVMAVNPDGTVEMATKSAATFPNSGISLSIDGQLYVGNSDGDMLCYLRKAVI